jgi:SAM-dependent methyltransferase
VPDATALLGPAEDIPLPDSSMDVVTVGQAFHWFDQPAALAEMRRVLRPGGIVGLLYNARDDREQWVADMAAIDGGGDILSQVEPERWAALAGDDGFVDVERRDFPNPVPFSAERLTGFAWSTSSVSTRPPAERDDALRRLAELAETHPDVAGRSSFPMPFVTVVVRAARR